MALLLGMGGVPARVATGFTTDTYVAAAKRWLVTDVDAHAWVEAWFPRYGWVTFDPTPAAAPARGGRSAIDSNGALGGTGGLTKLFRRGESPASAALSTARLHRGGSGAPVLLAAFGVLVALLALGLLAWSRS